MADTRPPHLMLMNRRTPPPTNDPGGNLPPLPPFITILHPPFHSPNVLFHLNAVSMKHAPNISSLSHLLSPGRYTFPVLAIEWMVFNSHTLYIPAPFMG